MVLKKWIQKGIDWLSNLILIVAGLVALWLFLLVFVYASFRIPTDSMEPTLVPGDYVLVNKLLIGPRLFNLTEALEGKQVNIRRLPGLHDIQRNDVLVFHFPHPHTWEMLHNNKAYEAATEGYVALYDILKQNPRYLFEAAQCLNHSERLEEGSQYLRQAVRYSSDPMIRYVLAKNEQEAGNYLEAERLLLHAIDILPERIYPYYLLANLYAEPDFYQPDKRQEMADSVWHKKPKVESQAIREMREKVKEWLNKQDK